MEDMPEAKKDIEYWQYSPERLRSAVEKVTHDPLADFLRLRLHKNIRNWLQHSFKLKVVNQSILEKQKNYIIVANHTSHLDVLSLFAALGEDKINDTFSIAASDYFFSFSFLEFISRVLANTVPFNRKFGAYFSLKACLKLLEMGKNLIIFPEGTRSKTGKMQEFKSGIGLLTAGKKYRVIPTYIKGTYEAWPKGKLFPRKSSITVILGEPLTFEHFSDSEENWQKIAHELENKVKELK